MKRALCMAAVCLLIAACTFVGTVIWVMRNVEVNWNHDSVSLYILGQEWVHDAYCDCADCEEGRFE